MNGNYNSNRNLRHSAELGQVWTPAKCEGSIKRSSWAYGAVLTIQRPWSLQPAGRQVPADTACRTFNRHRKAGYGNLVASLDFHSQRQYIWHCFPQLLLYAERRAEEPNHHRRRTEWLADRSRTPTAHPGHSYTSFLFLPLLTTIQLPLFIFISSQSVLSGAVFISLISCLGRLLRAARIFLPGPPE